MISPMNIFIDILEMDAKYDIYQQDNTKIMMDIYIIFTT